MTEATGAPFTTLAQAEANRFAQALGDNLVAIHHIGSASIAGIWAADLMT